MSSINEIRDLDARNHEMTLLKIKHIRLRERYGEGEIPHEAKIGTGPILLTCSFPYVRDWLNEHPFRNEPDARLICNLQTGAPITADSFKHYKKSMREEMNKQFSQIMSMIQQNPKLAQVKPEALKRFV
jgi:hypothetical protein